MVYSYKIRSELNNSHGLFKNNIRDCRKGNGSKIYSNDIFKQILKNIFLNLIIRLKMDIIISIIYRNLNK